MKRARSGSISDERDFRNEMKRARSGSISDERDFRAVKNAISAEVRAERRKKTNVITVVGLPDDGRSLEQQIYALSAAKTCVDYKISVSKMAEIAGVSEATIYKYISRLGQIKSDRSFLSIMTKRGRPTKYDPTADAAFMIYLEEPGRTFREKVVNTLPDIYRDISRKIERPVPTCTRAALAKHCERLYKRLGYSVRKPKLIEAKRCAIWSTLVSWYGDEYIKTIVGSAHPALVFNADETHINVRGHSPGKPLCKPGQRPSLAVDVRVSSHVSLVPFISAAGKVIDRVPVVHGPPETFLHRKSAVDGLCLFKSVKGYMDKKTFYRIIDEVFVPYVEELRKVIRELEGDKVNTHAVLFVDGHKSRYYAPTFKRLMEADIYLIILPAHSSHVTQPLDLRLNATIKSNFFRQWHASREKDWLETLVVSRDATPKDMEHPIKKGRGRKKKQQNPTLDEEFKPLEPVVVSGAEFERYLFLRAVSNAVHGLQQCSITDSWIQSHLFPFVNTPPTSVETQDELERQIKVPGVTVRRRKRQPSFIPLTGVVNSPKDQRLLRHLENNSKVRPLKSNKLVTYETKSKKKKTVSVSRDDRNADVGDRAIISRKGKLLTLSCESDADFVLTTKE